MPVPTRISFGSKDLKSVSVPHSHPLVIAMDIAYYHVKKVLADSGSSCDIISMDIAYYHVKKVLVDCGSSCDILFLSTFEAMGLSRSLLEPVGTLLQGFGGATVKPLGMVTLQTRLGQGEKIRNESLQFLVIDVPFAYNAIIGRPSLNQYEAVISTLHLKVKFPTTAGVAEICGDERQAPSCYLASLKPKDTKTRFSRKEKGKAKVKEGLTSLKPKYTKTRFSRKEKGKAKVKEGLTSLKPKDAKTRFSRKEKGKAKVKEGRLTPLKPKDAKTRFSRKEKGKAKVKEGIMGHFKN